MLNKARTLTGYKLHGLDGDIGSVKGFYFDDHHWTIRYLVADTGNWLRERQVLISPYALTSVVGDEHHIAVNLTRQQIESSPSLDTDKPVSRQFERLYYGYYEWPMYWGGSSVWGSFPQIVQDREQWKDPVPGKDAWDSHLRSTVDVTGYHIHAEDGEIGHVDDFIIEDETWTIRYLVIDTVDWWPGKKVLVSPQWIERISWGEGTVFVNLAREAVKESPKYTKASLLTRDYETSLHRHYDRRGYWDEHPAAAGGDLQ